MANSGIYWIDITFDWCVKFLYAVADFLNITYEEVNIWLFVIIGPLLFLISIYLNYYLYKKTKILKKKIEFHNKEFSATNELEIENKKPDFIKTLAVMILIIFIIYVLEANN